MPETMLFRNSRLPAQTGAGTPASHRCGASTSAVALTEGGNGAKSVPLEARARLAAPFQQPSVVFVQRPNLLEEVSAKLAELLAASPARDIEKNLRALVSSALGRLELVPREEFDVQAKVLARAREQLAALEARVAELERQLNR